MIHMVKASSIKCIACGTPPTGQKKFLILPQLYWYLALLFLDSMPI